MVAMQYAHKPGIARSMNAFMADLAKRHPAIIGTATVLPGEPDAPSILKDAFESGLRGVKFHCHVQCMPADSPDMFALYELCAELH